MWQSEGKVFVVAEIGQNHQGSVDVAKRMIQTAKDCGADCVKFQRSTLEEKFTSAALARPYGGPNSWGQTYGQHKAFLEFTLDQYRELQRFASDAGVLFTASAMDMVSFRELEEQLRVPFIKIGSGDADNVPLLRYAATRTRVPLVVSTGMQSWEQIQRIGDMFGERNNVALLHCISAYPTPPEDTMLRLIPLYRDRFPHLTVGYSGHEMGVQLTIASVALGARIIERHFTLDKTWKGTDHRASLDPPEFTRMVQYIRTIEADLAKDTDCVEKLLANVLDASDYDGTELHTALKEMRVEDRKMLQSEKPCHSKLGKSLVYAKNCFAGHTLHEQDLAVKVSEPQGLSPWCYDSVVGRTVRRTVALDDPIFEQHF
ncbi:sialic acid synthase [Anopheles bellator]|uniref:sialic acid synthase n=1 Tax=Anopheles bellator TaxID=139047 RepID=UPI002647594F|nr:sialic acid synthase [Anopheles bellator]